METVTTQQSPVNPKHQPTRVRITTNPENPPLGATSMMEPILNTENPEVHKKLLRQILENLRSKFDDFKMEERWKNRK